MDNVFSEVSLHNDFYGNPETFTVSEHFVPRSNPQISYVGDKFRQYFFRKSIVGHEGYQFATYKLIQLMSDAEVLSKIEQEYHRVLPTSLDFIWSLLQNQPNNDCMGRLGCRGESNVFHVFDMESDIPRVVSVFWRSKPWTSKLKLSFEKGWNIRSYSPEQMKIRKWHVGTKFFVAKGDRIS